MIRSFLIRAGGRIFAARYFELTIFFSLQQYIMNKNFNIKTYVEDEYEDEYEEDREWVAECCNIVGVGATESEAIRRLLLALAAYVEADFDGFMKLGDYDG